MAAQARLRVGEELHLVPGLFLTLFPVNTFLSLPQVPTMGHMSCNPLQKGRESSQQISPMC